MPPELVRKFQQQGMSPQAAQAKAYPSGSPGNPAAAGPASATRAPGIQAPPGGATGGKGSAVQQVLSAAQRVIQMASQLGILDQLKQLIAQADQGPGRAMAGGPPRPPMGGPPRPPTGGPPGGMARGGAPVGGMPGRKPPGMI